MRARVLAATVFVVVVTLPVVANGQQADGPEWPPPGWQDGPCVGVLGSHATIRVPAGYVWLDRTATRDFLELAENPPSGREVGAVIRVVQGMPTWFVVFSFADVGYVHDRDRDTLDPDAILDGIRRATEASNALRRRRGWREVSVDGWFERPFYDASTNNLTWAILGHSGTEQVVNRSIRLLGRRGYMSAQLVADPEEAKAAAAELDDLLAGFSFNPGERYAEFRAGDKLAGYGLAALIGGSAAVVATKTGLLQKFGKLLVALAVGLLMALKGLVTSLVGRFTGRGARPADVPAEGEWH